MKRAIVTGANSGVGLETARALVARGYDLTLAVRDVAKGQEAARTIGGGTSARLDLADLDSVRAFAAEFRGPLDVLVNNAGIHTTDPARSPQGHELTFATNHLGPFLLTELLRPKLTPGARIVNVASEAHRFAFDHKFHEADAWSGIRAYTASKLANVMFTYALARRLDSASAFAVHPGSVRTRWARDADSGAFRFVTALASPFMISAAQGARTSVFAATSRELDGQNGLYLLRERISKSSRVSRDMEAQEALWSLSERLVQ